MNRWRTAALALVLGFALWPEIGRYRGERELYLAAGILQHALSRSGESDRLRALDSAETIALRAASRLRSDSRALVVAGSTRLASRRAQDALVHYRNALELGERPEIDLNVGRAYAILDRRPEAFAAFLRTIWISPALLSSLPVAAQDLVAREIEKLSQKLAAGELGAPPPLPR